MSNMPRFTLSEICENIMDGSHFSPQLTNDGYPYITVRDIVEDSINFADCKYVNEQDYRKLAGNGCKPSKGDVLFSKDGTVGKVALVDTSREFVVLSSLAILRPDQSRVFPPYLKYALKSPEFLKVALGKKTGAAIRRIILRNLKSIEIPLPPLAEQKRIVALLDEAFAGIDEAKAKAEDNALGAKRAFQSILETLLSPTATGWTERKLDDLCVIKGRIGYRGYTKNDLVEKGHGAITLSPSNIKQNRFVADDCTYISWFKYDESPEIMVFEGDILFVKTGSTYGKVAIARDLPEKATINPQFVVLKEMKCNNWFLYYSMTTNSFRGGVECIVGGAATPTISQANLGELTIHVPSIGTQETIVKQLDAAHEAATLLGALYKQKVTALNELKSSLLTQAFAGELTA